MKDDELAFLNHQLAAMLHDGIPLEGALHRLCEEMGAGPLRDELRALETDLSKGAPIEQALASRRLPELYKRLVLVGVKSGDLPGALRMLADYFQRRHRLWTRLKGLMVYPAIVLSVSFVLSCFLFWLLHHYIWKNLVLLSGRPVPAVMAAGLWIAPSVIGLVLAAGLVAVAVSPWRRKLRWRLPAFRQASLAEVASAVWLMLKNGVPLDDALALVEDLEGATIAQTEIARWRSRLAAGHGKFSEMAAPVVSAPPLWRRDLFGKASKTTRGGVFPPLFVWTVAQSGEDLAGGFERAAKLYEARAQYRAELLLYSALPCSILALAIMIISQIQPVFAGLIAFLNAIGH